MILASCAADKPIPETSTSDYPCGIDGIVCGGGMCCEQGEMCGGPFPIIGCPEGECCFVGESALGMPHHPMSKGK